MKKNRLRRIFLIIKIIILKMNFRGALNHVFCGICGEKYLFHFNLQVHTKDIGSIIICGASLFAAYVNLQSFKHDVIDMP